MIIRKAKLNDLSNITNLSYRSAIYHKELTSYYDTDKNIKKILEVSLKKNIYSSNSSIFVAELDNKIVGYILAFKINRPEIFKEKKAGLIADIFIQEEFRKKGIGDSLVKECFNWFKKNNINFIEISVEYSNTQALSFWNKKGFKDVSIEKYKKI